MKNLTLNLVVRLYIAYVKIDLNSFYKFLHIINVFLKEILLIFLFKNFHLIVIKNSYNLILE
jgi:hypothetical protein